MGISAYLGVPHPNDSALVTGDDTAFINIVDIDDKGKSVSTVDGVATPVTERRNISTIYCVNSVQFTQCTQCTVCRPTRSKHTCSQYQ
jgi:hypothetical protein